MGSRFCSQAEQRYAPIEGEALAAAWGANKCRYYLLGIKNWLLARSSVDRLQASSWLQCHIVSIMQLPRALQKE